VTTKVIGGTVLDLSGTAVPNAQVTITLMTKVAFRVSDGASVVPEIQKFTNGSGVWTATVECNDTITPVGTLYEIAETYSLGGWKRYLIQVLSTLPGGTNQVLGLIVPQMSPVGVVNSFLTKALADTLYQPLGGGGGGGSSVTEYNEDDVAPANPTGPTVVAVRADALSAQGSDGDWIALRVTSKGELYVKVVDAISITGTVAVSGPLTDTQLRASPIAVTGGGGGVQYDEGNTDASITGTAILWEDTADTLRSVSAAKPLPVGVQGTVPVSGPLTDTQLRASAVPVSGTVTASGPLTDTQLRASAVPVSLASVPSHAVTNAGTFAVQADTELPTAAALADATANPTVPAVGGLLEIFNGTTWDRARGDITNGLDVDVTRVSGTVAVSGPLTDTQLRASAVPVSGPVTDTQLRASAVPVSLASVPSHAVTNAGTFAVQADTELSTAAALADAAANPTTALVGALAQLFNGTTWDRMRGDITNGLDVDVTRLPALVAGAQVIGKVAAEQITSAGPTQKAMSTTSATLIANNANRKGFMIYNDAAVALFVKFGATASATSFNVKIPAGAIYEQPVPGGWIYTGVIDGILVSGTGNAYVTEV